MVSTQSDIIIQEKEFKSDYKGDAEIHFWGPYSTLEILCNGIKQSHLVCLFA